MKTVLFIDIMGILTRFLHCFLWFFLRTLINCYRLLLVAQVEKREKYP